MTACVLPGCINHVEEAGDTCAECIDLFGDMLRPNDTRLTAEQIAARDTETRNQYKGRI